jgi:hypothetical protein
MKSSLIFLRLIHIVLGVAWAGTIFFFVTYLEPSVRAVGPDGGKVMLQLFSRRYLNVLPAVAGLTILSGLAMLWITSNGFDPVWMRSRMGIGLSIGAACALIAFGIGMAVMRRAAVRLWAIMRAMPQINDESERAARMAEAQSLRDRARTSARWVAALLLIAVGAMAVSRYL